MKRLAGLILPLIFLLSACGGSAESDTSDDSDSKPEAEESGETTELPGGSVDNSVLPKDRWFTDDGLLKRTQIGAGQEGTGEEACKYLFGTPKEVAETAGLTGDAKLKKGGYLYLGDDGEGYQCIYMAGEQGYAMRVWSNDADLPGDFSHRVSIEADNGSVGLAVYSANFDGDVLSEDTVEQWLTQALDRVEAPKEPSEDR